MKSLDHLEEIRFCNARSRKAASELNEEVVSANASKQMPKGTSCRNIFVGTDCSGIEVPIQALRNIAGVHF